MTNTGECKQHLQERLVEGRRLGRHIHHDPKSRKFGAAQARKIKDVLHEATGLPLNQTRGSCTAEALCGALNSRPDFKGGHVFSQADADTLYDQEIVLEGGNPQSDDPGGTGLYICKVAKAAGLIRRYEHAFGLDHALKALVKRPVITGVNWYTSFDEPDAEGRIALTPGAEVRGGHEFVVDQIDTANRLVGCWQSWGPDWGAAGRFYMPFSVWDRLLGEQGDVTVPLT